MVKSARNKFPSFYFLFKFPYTSILLFPCQFILLNFFFLMSVCLPQKIKNYEKNEFRLQLSNFLKDFRFNAGYPQLLRNLWNNIRKIIVGCKILTFFLCMIIFHIIMLKEKIDKLVIISGCHSCLLWRHSYFMYLQSFGGYSVGSLVSGIHTI